MGFTARTGPKLPCPQCREAGRTSERIGNKKTKCGTCNRFNQQARRETLNRLKEKYPELYERLRLEGEAAAYPRVMDEYTMRKLEGLE